MAKNRVIPFGYCMKNGKIMVDFKESKAVVKIFEEYLGGNSLLQIAKLMESEMIKYSEGSDKWTIVNKVDSKIEKNQKSASN